MSGIADSVYNNLSFSLNRQFKTVARLQEQISTGSRINRASDDPSTSYHVLGLNTQERSLKSYMTNISAVQDILKMSSDMVVNMSSVITDATALLTRTGTTDNETLALGIDEMLEHMVAMANTNHMNQYLFGGDDTSTVPYVVERTNGKISSVTYQGSSDAREVEVADGVETNSFYVGDDIFRSDDRIAPTFFGDSGAAAGSGTASVTGDVWLTIVNNGDGTFGLSIDGGTAVTTDGTDANLAVKNTNDQVLYIDTTGISSTGTNIDMVSISGTHDIFGVLINARDVLNNTRGLDGDQLPELLANALASLTEVKDLLATKGFVISSQDGFLQNIKETHQDIQFNVSDETVRQQEANIAQLAIDISQQEILYQMSLSVAGRIMSMSLLDFLR